MKKLLEHAKTNLAEELKLVEGLVELARKTGEAILDRSLDKLTMLGARHQNALVRLEMTRKSQRHLIDGLCVHAKIPAAKQIGLHSILTTLGRADEFPGIEDLKVQIAELKALNEDNTRLLAKQYSAVTTYQNVIDMVRGVEKMYARDGSIKNIIVSRRLEQRG